MRGPIKNQAFQVLRNRGIRIGTVLDVGVLTGTAELMAHFPQALHLLFEPVVDFNPDIERNYRRVRHEIVNVAISDSTGETLLETYRLIDVGGHSVSHSNVASEAAEGRTYRTVPRTTLDDFLKDRKLAEPYLLKIDVDGHELAVIAGAAETLKKCAVVMVETTIDELPERIAAVAAHGFTLFDLAEPCYYDNAFYNCDAILLRSDLHKRLFAQFDEDFDYAKYTVFAPPPRPRAAKG
ncbi:MAG TPA: FkbM family methyltransferase [Sphingomicrobium sp.]|nr:FkbM family methyltransferase [Sphingomicrobium sp.]